MIAGLRRRPLAALALVVVGGAALAGALYGTLAPAGNRVPPECAGAAAEAQRLAPLAKGEIAALAFDGAPQPLPAIAFDAPDGRRITLADLGGKVLLVNLWATWCAPCRKEMPALDKLQELAGGADFEVVAINVDTRNLDKPRAWLADAGITRLGYYADREAKVFPALRQAGRLVGMPTTYLIDRKGCALATLNGAAEWAGEEALALVAAAKAAPR